VLAKAVLERGIEPIGIVLGVCAAYAAYKWRRRRAATGALDAPRMSVAELKELMGGNTPPVIVDVRGNAIQQADRRHIPGALFTTVGEVVQSVAAHPKSVLIVLYCACPNDASAAQGARALTDAGYARARALRGGLDAWCSDVEGHSG
jgi:rhodanese-related sulfurtransferase